MNDKNSENKGVPQKMKSVAFPKAKYGFYLAIFIILLVLFLMYKDFLI